MWKLLTLSPLSFYQDIKTVNIGDEFYIIALTSNGKKPKWSSSSSSIASVNSMEKLLQKKPVQLQLQLKLIMRSLLQSNS